MNIIRTYNAIAVGVVKGQEHFVLAYPRTPHGRLAAWRAVQTWLLDCELDFDRQDAEQFWRAIDEQPLDERHDRHAAGPVRWDTRKRI